MSFDRSIRKENLLDIRVVAAILVFMVLMLIGVYQLQTYRVKSIPLSDCHVETDKKFMYSLTSISKDEKMNTVFQGWAVDEGTSYPYYNYGNGAYREGVYNKMYVGFADSNNVYLLPTKLRIDTTVYSYLPDDIDYKYCGYTSLLSKDKEYLRSLQLCLVMEDVNQIKYLMYMNEDEINEVKTN